MCGCCGSSEVTGLPSEVWDRLNFVWVWTCSIDCAAYYLTH